LKAGKKIEEFDGDHAFPLPYLLFFVGYCMVLLIDRVFAGEHGHSHIHGQSNDDDHNHEEKEATQRKLNSESPSKSSNQAILADKGLAPTVKPDEVVDIEVNDFDEKNPKLSNGPIIANDSHEDGGNKI